MIMKLLVLTQGCQDEEDVSIQFVDSEDMTIQEVLAFEGASKTSQQPAPLPEFVDFSVNEDLNNNVSDPPLVEEENVAPAPRKKERKATKNSVNDIDDVSWTVTIMAMRN